MMRRYTIFILLFLIVSCGDSKKIFHYEGEEFWSEHHAKNTTTLHYEYEVYSKGSDTIVHITNYYQNGSLKSKVIMKNDQLKEIEFVKDSLGNNLDYGKLKSGNGYVIQYSSYNGVPEEEGRYINGNREGWWKTYHYTGWIMDSTYYENGYPQYPESDDAIMSLLDLFGPMKNNLYH